MSARQEVQREREMMRTLIKTLAYSFKQKMDSKKLYKCTCCGRRVSSSSQRPINDRTLRLFIGSRIYSTPLLANVFVLYAINLVACSIIYECYQNTHQENIVLHSMLRLQIDDGVPDQNHIRRVREAMFMRRSINVTLCSRFSLVTRNVLRSHTLQDPQSIGVIGMPAAGLQMYCEKVITKKNIDFDDCLGLSDAEYKIFIGFGRCQHDQI